MNPIQHFRFIAFLLLISLAACQKNQIQIPGLQEEVEVIRDENGINHIFAQNEQDLFFTQGYLAARDRLFQFELWRRQATGTLSEILGERELERDRGVRLFKFRGDKETELRHYHPRGVEIVDAFVEGINTYIAEVRENPELLPIEFKMLDMLPEYWTWEVVISRHQGLLENVVDELNISRVVSQIGPQKAKELYYFHPNEPILDLDPNIPEELLMKDILAPYQAFRRRVEFRPEDIEESYRINQAEFEKSTALLEESIQYTLESDAFAQGSNNWVISGEKTASGFPFMANDPHRLQAVPSLRYWVHLNAPGWNVIGAGEPEIPGVSIGHNDYGAWGLTIFSTDNEDLRIYDISPENPDLYFFQGEWKEMEKIQDTIRIKGGKEEIVTHRYTIHGPVTFVDEDLNKAVAVECAWLEPGSAPYLASLRMDQSQTWEEFREACTFNNIPAENMVWAGKDGTIGWQATGIAPIRRGFSGLIATTGDGNYEWDGYLPIEDRPHSVNPESGFIATANQNVAEENYPFPEALGYEWADDFRGERIKEVLRQDKKFTVSEMGALQNDYLALPARRLIPFLKSLTWENERVDSLSQVLQAWDFVLSPNSIEAGVYVMWERILRDKVSDFTIPKEVKPWLGSIQLTRVLEWMENPEMIYPNNPDQNRNDLLKDSLIEAIDALKRKLGLDPKKWPYGQADYKHAQIIHPLGLVVNKEWQDKLNTEILPRGGYSFTPGANAYGDNNTSGASFRIVVDTGDWENTIGINTPGQSGNPESPFYKNLFPIWANDEFVGIPFSKEKIQSKKAYTEQFYPKN
ncbi:penicillin acylase family protein [Algoriphagus kandeliae]|uniref:Penicillin acylase family protein n=1 Tax=Algoriphagus kandeliae TaxID=2562278 RepID=A0A4Y9QN53_9BACT|nr:penicillin acylase family protein [Algoriphagus kandeliae]TFV93288.1 penicillin acylase family protein [Algoriphagus kandeliae]